VTHLGKKNKKTTMKKETKEIKEKKPNFFVRMFMDNNDINEKSIVGFGAFLMMMICLGVDVYTGLQGQDMPINEFVFDGFLYITLGSFGIASLDKFITAKNGKKEEEEAY
jgi:hypothetical protein